MNKEVYKEMCSQIYEGESWDRMINCLERKDKEIERLKEEYVILQNASDEVEEELQQRIDKAIEYIEERKNLNWYAEGVFVCELLNILQEVDKE